MRLLGKRFGLWILLSLITFLLAACGSAAGGATDSLEEVIITTTDTPDSPLESGVEETKVEVVEETAVEVDPTAVVEEMVEESEATAEPEPTVVVEETTEEVEPTVEVEEIDESEVAETAEPEEGILTEDDRFEFLVQVTESWNTNWNRHTVSYDEFLPGQLRDRIRSIDDPKFETIFSAKEWLVDTEPVMVFEWNGAARAYPLQILILHEIVNDVVEGMPVVVTYCPLCNSAVVFDRRFNGQVLEFGTSGLLRFSDLVMYDRNTESLWQQFTGEGLVGDLAGEQLTILPTSLVSFAGFQSAFPNGLVLSQDTGFPFSYGLNPYVGYDTQKHALSRDGQFLLFQGEIDERLDPVERVVSIIYDDGVAMAYPVTTLAEVGVINDSPGGHDVVVFHTPGTASALDAELVATGSDVGATGVFNPTLNGQKLTFSKDGDNIVDDLTGTIWNVLGQAIEGPLEGETLTPVVHGDHFWFSWAAFFPNTIIYEM